MVGLTSYKSCWALSARACLSCSSRDSMAPHFAFYHGMPAYAHGMSLFFLLIYHQHLSSLYFLCLYEHSSDRHSYLACTSSCQHMLSLPCHLPPPHLTFLWCITIHHDRRARVSVVFFFSCGRGLESLRRAATSMPLQIFSFM